jgi:hypothetical protein
MYSVFDRSASILISFSRTWKKVPIPDFIGKTAAFSGSHEIKEAIPGSHENNAPIPGSRESMCQSQTRVELQEVPNAELK